jgi:hypothetical protein
MPASIAMQINAAYMKVQKLNFLTPGLRCTGPTFSLTIAKVVPLSAFHFTITHVRCGTNQRGAEKHQNWGNRSMMPGRIAASLWPLVPGSSETALD